MTQTELLRARLDELGIKYTTDDSDDYEIVEWQGSYNLWWQFVYDPDEEEPYGELRLLEAGGSTHLTPEQAIAATVGNAREPSNAVIERIERFCTDYAQCLMDSTILVKRNYESMDRRALEKAEVVEDRLIRELAEDIATVGRSCASCPEMDNTDSYISHLQSALKWHDEHVPRPTNQRSSCVVLQGQKPPEEVLFVRDEGGVTHYLPEETCHLEECEHEREIPHDLPDCDGGWYTEVTHDCDECGYENADPNIRFCGGCGRKVVAE